MEKENSVKIGVCWYKEEQWERLKEIVPNPEDIEDTYQQWRKDAENAISQLREKGMDVKKVSVDTEEMLLWANEHGHQLDGDARTQYAIYLMKKREKR